MKILYLEDDMILSNTVEEILLDEGYSVTTASSAQDVIDLVYKESFDIFIFDVNLPDMNGFELLESLRSAGITTATIFTTSLESIENISQAYRVGADDYLKKPFFVDELLFRVKAVLKREFHSFNSIIKVGERVSFNSNTHELFHKNEVISLNLKEATLLKLFLKYKNECINFEHIYQTLWGYDEEHSEKSLRTYIKNLRHYLGKESIVSIKKVGYKFLSF